MRQFNSTDRRALVAATCLLGLGTVVRITLAPDTAEIAWRPATAERAAETLVQARRDVNEALDREAEATRPLGPQERIDINSADETVLRRLPGVGPSRAAAIVRDRKSRGPFRSLQDLSRVPGIGQGLIERLSPHIDTVSVSASTLIGHKSRIWSKSRESGRRWPRELSHIEPVTAGSQLLMIFSVCPVLAQRSWKYCVTRCSRTEGVSQP